MQPQQSPQEALATILKSREQALEKMDYWPWWYDVGYAVACALLVAGQGFPTLVGMICLVAAMAILIAIMRMWQARTGVWVNGYAPRRARWAAFGLAAVMMGLMGLSIWFGRVQDVIWVPLACGAAAAVLAVIGMRVWMRLYRSDVRSVS